jgi:hypothetical protein
MFIRKLYILTIFTSCITLSKSVGLAAALETIPATIPHNTLIDKVSSEIIKETIKA